MRVLVVDDEPDVLLLCKLNLGLAGHEVLEAEDGERGLQVAASEHPDLIVLDVMLPRRDGLSVLEILGERPETRDVPVVLLSARSRDEDRLLGWVAGASEYVTKPFCPKELADAIDRVHRMSPAERRRYREESVEELASILRDLEEYPRAVAS